MKCELVSCLLHEPKLIILDEPTIGLDLVSQKKLRTFIRNYCRENSITLILTSHLADDIEEICDRVIVLKNGKIMLDEKKSIVFENVLNKAKLNLTVKNNLITSEIPEFKSAIIVGENTYQLKIDKKDIFILLQKLNQLDMMIDYEILGISTSDIIMEMYNDFND